MVVNVEQEVLHMKFSHALLIVCLLFIAKPSSAQETVTSEKVVTILGVRDCSAWNDATSGSDEDIGVVIGGVSNRAWALGYVSGLAGASPRENILRDLDSDTVLDWIDRYCQSNPSQGVSEAVNEMFRRLGRYPYCCVSED